MAGVNWSHAIAGYHDAFLSAANIDQYCHFRKLLEEDYDEKSASTDSPMHIPMYDQLKSEAVHRHNMEAAREKESIDLANKVRLESGLKLKSALCRVPRKYPRPSKWNQERQAFVVEKMRQWSISGPPQAANDREQLELNDFISLMESMREERDEFMKFVEQVNMGQLDSYNEISRRSSMYLNDCLTEASKRAWLYPRYYTELRKISLLTSSKGSSVSSIMPVGESLDIGITPVCCIPRMSAWHNLKRFCASLRNFFPPRDVYPLSLETNTREKVDGRYLYKCTVSCDPNVDLLSRSMPVDFVTTPSVLKMLLKKTVPTVDSREWEIPVRISLVEPLTGGASRKVIFLDKPLPPRTLDILEVKRCIHKRSVRLLTCKRVKKGEEDYSVWSEERIAALKVEKDNQKAENKIKNKSADNRETNQDGVSDRLSKESNPSAMPDESSAAEQCSSDESSDGENLQMDIPDDESIIEDVSEKASVIDQHGESCDETNGNTAIGEVPDMTQHVIVSQPAEKTPVATVDSSHSERAKASPSNKSDSGLLQPPPGTAFNYRFWQLGTHGVLLRTHTHGMLESPTLKELVVYTVHVKVNHQPSYGLEVMTVGELIDQWVDCMLRPGSRILRVHIDPESRNVLCVQELSLHQLERQLVDYRTGFTPKVGLATLDGLLTPVAALSPGKYLLRGGKNHPTSVCIMCAEGQSEAVGGNNWLDLWSMYSKSPTFTTLSKAPWLPIDTSVLTPYNVKFGRVPGLFNYRPAKSEKRQLRNEKRAKGGSNRPKRVVANASATPQSRQSGVSSVGGQRAWQTSTGSSRGKWKKGSKSRK